MMKAIGNYFRQARLNAKLTIENAARTTSIIHEDELAELERGEFSPPVDVLAALVACYNLHPNELTELLYEVSALNIRRLSGLDRRSAVVF